MDRAIARHEEPLPEAINQRMFPPLLALQCAEQINLTEAPACEQLQSWLNALPPLPPPAK